MRTVRAGLGVGVDKHSCQGEGTVARIQQYSTTHLLPFIFHEFSIFCISKIWLLSSCSKSVSNLFLSLSMAEVNRFFSAS